MTARASGALASEPVPMPSAIGIRPTTVQMLVIRMGRSRVRPPSITASRTPWPCRRNSFMYSTSSTPFDTTMPTIMMMPMKDVTLSVVRVRNSDQMTSNIPSGTENMMMKGSRSERNCEAMTMYTRMMASKEVNFRLPKASRCCWICPVSWNWKPGGRGRALSLSSMSCAIEPKSLPWRGGDLDEALLVLALDHDGPDPLLDLGHRAERDGPSAVTDDEEPREVLRRRPVGFVQLHDHIILVTGSWIRENRGVEADITSQRDQGGLGDVSLAEPRHRRLFPVDDDIVLRVVLLAADEGVGDARDVHERPRDLAAEVPGVPEVIAELFHLDGRVRAGVQHTAHDAPELDAIHRAGKLGGELRADVCKNFLVIPRPFVRVGEIHLYLRGVWPGVSGKEAGAPARYADGGDDRVDLSRLGRSPDDLLHLPDDPLGLL